MALNPILFEGRESRLRILMPRSPDAETHPQQQDLPLVWAVHPGSKRNSDILLIAPSGTVDISATDATDCGIGKNDLICCEPFTREGHRGKGRARVFSSPSLTGGRKP
jgi:hypothetical protein